MLKSELLGSSVGEKPPSELERGDEAAFSDRIGGERGIDRERRTKVLHPSRGWEYPDRVGMAKTEIPVGVDHDCWLDTSAGRAAGRSYCHPDAFEPNSNYLFRNNGDGTFTDVSAPAGIQAAEGKGLGVVFGDINDDGRIDISVANDSVPQLLFQNQGNGSFAESGVSLR